MKVEILLVIFLPIIHTVLLQEHGHMQKRSYMNILGKRSKFFYSINYKIHSITNKLFLSLKLNKNAGKSSNFQFLLKTHLYFNNKAQKHYAEYEKLVNPTSEHTCRIGDQKLDETIQIVVQEKFDRIKNGLNGLLLDVIKTLNKLIYIMNNIEFNSNNILHTDLNDKVIKNIVDPVVKDNTDSNDTISIKEKISQDLNALKKMLWILERFDTSNEDIATYKEQKGKDGFTYSNHNNNLTNTLQNIVNKEIETIKNNVTKLADITQIHLESLLDIMKPNEAKANISFDHTLLTLTEKTMENVIDEIICDIETPNNTEHTFDNVTLSSEELDLVLFPTNASIHEPLETRRIYHGKKTRVRSYPFLASLHLASEFLCAGSIISVDLLITAASCLQMIYKNEVFRSNPKTIFARVGSDFPKRSGKLIPIVAVIFHPKYDPVTLKNNLAIVKMLKKLKHTKEKKIKRIKYDKEAGVLKRSIGEVKIIGWGARDEKDSQIGVQRPSVAHLDIYDINDCKEIYSKYYVTETNFCAGFTSKGGGACTGDVGGPAVVSKKLVGVVSFGPTVCGMLDAPTVFTKVGYYADWIEEVIHTSRANQSKLHPITVNSTELPQLVVIPVFTGKNTTKKELEPVTNYESQLNQGQQLVSNVNIATNEGQTPITNEKHKISQSQKSAILMPNQVQKSNANTQLNQGIKSYGNSPLRQGQRPSYKNIQYGPNQKPPSYGLSQLNPNQMPIAREKPQVGQDLKPMYKMNPRFGQKHVPNQIFQNKLTMKTYTYKNPKTKQDLIPIFVNQRYRPKHITKNILESKNKDELSIIQQVIQDMILGNETVIDYLANEKVFDYVSEFVENISKDSERQLFDHEQSKLNGNFKLLRDVKLHTTPSNNIINAQTNALDDESYYDGKPTQIAKFIQSLEIPKEDASSYYEMEIPIEAAPFTRSPPGQGDETENDEYHYQDTTAVSRITDIIYGTKINYGSNKQGPYNKIYHKAMDENERLSFEKRQYNNNYSPMPIYKDSFNIYHKDTDSDREIHNIIEIKDEKRVLKSITGRIENRDLRSQTEKNENINSKIISERNENRDSRNRTVKNEIRDNKRMIERNENRDLRSITTNNENMERSMTYRYESKESRSMTEKNENTYSKSRIEKDLKNIMNRNNNRDISNKNLDSRSITESNGNRERSMIEGNENRGKRMSQRNTKGDSLSMNERNEDKTKDIQYETRTEALYKDDSLQLEKEINLEIGGVAAVISQEDFNYAYNEEKAIEMRSRKGDQYYDFDFMMDYNY